MAGGLQSLGLLAAVCLASCWNGLALQSRHSCVRGGQCMYQRPSPVPQLHTGHPRLARPAGAGAHDPEQVGQRVGCVWELAGEQD